MKLLREKWASPQRTRPAAGKRGRRGVKVLLGLMTDVVTTIMDEVNEGRAEEDRDTEYMVLKARPKGLKVPSNPKQDRNQ